MKNYDEIHLEDMFGGVSNKVLKNYCEELKTQSTERWLTFINQEAYI